MTRRGTFTDLLPINQYPVAEHRYRYDTPISFAIEDAKTYQEFRDAVPYKNGDVVYIAYEDGYRLAMITEVFRERDVYGDWREKFRVQIANADGKTFAKKWFYTYPGFIQRGYQRAGLAPEMPKDV